MAKQTTFRTYDAKTVGNISLTYGLMAIVRAGFRRLGLYDYLVGFKEKGVPLSYAIEIFRTKCQCELWRNQGNSKRCAEFK